jgi:hypothetical protein
MSLQRRNWPCALLATIALVTPLRAAAPQTPAANPKPKQPVEIAAEFLKLAIAGEDANALKLVVPGTVSENKVAEIRRAGYSRGEFVLVLINDTRVEAVTKEQRARKVGEPEGHLIIMVVKAKDGAWRVKDLDIRDNAELKPRIELYLAGRYNEKPANE